MPVKKHKTLPKLRFRHTQSPQHRIVPVGGVWGGLTPNGFVQVGFFSDLRVAPESVIRDQEADAEVTKVASTDTVEFERVTEFTALMSPATAKLVADWLLTKCVEAEEAHARARQTDADEG